MNSTLPNLSALPAASATVAQPNAAILAGLMPGVGAATTSETTGTRPADFSAFMPASPAATPAPASGPTAASVTLHATLTPAAELSGAVTGAAPVIRGPSGDPSPDIASVQAGDCTSVARPLAPRPTKWNRNDLTAESNPTPTPSWSGGALAPEAASTLTAANTPEVFSSTIAGEASPSKTVPEEIREQAVAFAATLLQSLLPDLTPEPQATLVPAMSIPTTESSTDSSMPVVSPMHARATAGLAVRPSAPEGSGNFEFMTVGEHAAPAPLPKDQANVPPQVPANSSASLTSARPALAGEGAFAFKLATPPTPPADAVSVAGQGTDEPMEFRADLTLPGQPVVRVESSGYSLEARSAATSAAINAVAPQANFAANGSAHESRPEARRKAGERNFESANAEQLTTSPAPAGITVAKSEPAMPATPLEARDVRLPHDPLALIGRPEFQLAPAPAERMAAPMSAPAAQNLAERAVDTVTNLIDTQFSASMQKSGSVQLHLKFGGEDLSVRVELRDGAVHTAFRTDSAPLRAALEREWQAVAATSPEHLHRFAEPVFSPGSSQSNSFTQGDARQQPQHQAQPDGQQRAPRDSFSDHPAFNRRSLVSETFVPETPTPRVAAFLPTSLRLSALA